MYKKSKQSSCSTTFSLICSDFRPLFSLLDAFFQSFDVTTCFPARAGARESVRLFLYTFRIIPWLYACQCKSTSRSMILKTMIQQIDRFTIKGTLKCILGFSFRAGDAPGQLLMYRRSVLIFGGLIWHFWFLCWLHGLLRSWTGVPHETTEEHACTSPWEHPKRE